MDFENFFHTFSAKQKREMFYGKESTYANLDELEQAIIKYIHYYNTERTKEKLKGLTPIQYRNQSVVA